MASNGSKKKNSSSQDKDPVLKALEENKTFQLLKKISFQLCFFNAILAILYLIIGIVVHFFYEEKTYLFIFGMLCLLQIISAPLLYITLKTTNQSFYLAIALINLVWITATIILLLVYKLLMTNEQFHKDLVFHMSSLFFVGLSSVLAICYFLMMQLMSSHFKEDNKKGSKPSSKLGPEKGHKNSSEIPIKGKENKKDTKKDQKSYGNKNAKNQQKKDKTQVKRGKK